MWQLRGYSKKQIISEGLFLIFLPLVKGDWLKFKKHHMKGTFIIIILPTAI